MDFDLAEMDFKFLQDLRMSQYSNLIALQLEKDAEKAGHITDLTNFVKKLDAEIKRRKKDKQFDEKFLDAKNQVQTEGFATNNYTSHQIKSMSNVIATEVPIFSSGLDVHTWLNKLESYYKLYVVEDTTGVMEKHFIQNAKSRLCPEYLHAMLGSSDATDKFEGMKAYMKKNHASKMSVFQILDTLWEMERTESESYRDLALKLDDKVAEAENIIEAKFKEFCESKGESANEIKISDVYKLVSGQIFLQTLKNEDRIIYNNICNDLDKTWSAKDIALKAMTYRDRMASSDDSQNQGSVPDAFTVQRGKSSNQNKGSRQNKSQNSGKQDCWYFIVKGKCTKPGCDRYHSREKHAAFEKTAKTGNKKGDNKGPNAKQSDNAKDKNAKSGNPGNTQPTSYAAAASEIPMVPLPTQNFRE